MKVSYFHWWQPPLSFPGCLHLLCAPHYLPTPTHAFDPSQPITELHLCPETGPKGGTWTKQIESFFLCGSLNWIRVKRTKQPFIPLSSLVGRKPGASKCHTPAYMGKSCLCWGRIQYLGKGTQPCRRFFIFSDIHAFSSSGWPRICFCLCEFGMRFWHNPKILVCHSPLCKWHPLHFLEKLSETCGRGWANALQKTGLDVLCRSTRFRLQNVLCC